jgi:hypothetical protein
LGGVIRDFEVAPGHVADVTVGAELLAAHHDLTVLGDKEYISAPLAAALHTERQIRLLTLPRENQRIQATTVQRQRHNHLRQLIETVNGQIAQQFHLEINHAHSFWRFTARTLTKLTAHTLCIWLSCLLGNPAWLQLKQLAFPI